MKKREPKSSTKSSTNTFFGKAIENWLTNTNELGYQLPFCQLLVNDGFRILHISKGTAFEQGKDIIAVKDDVTHLYQLKGGDITLNHWRLIVRPEIEELIGLKVEHPSIEKKGRFIPYLVTNGYLDDTVRVQIDKLNREKWKRTPLKVILLGELLEKFLKWSYDFTPKELRNYETLLQLYFADGKSFADSGKLASLIESVLRIHDEKLSKEECRRNIAAAILFGGYISSAFRKADNHISLIQILTVIAGGILGVVEKFSLPRKYWYESFELVWNEIAINAGNLEKEIINDGFEKTYSHLWDGELAKYRHHVAATYLTAFKLGQAIKRDERWNSLLENNLLISLVGSLTIWGEAAYVGFILCYLYCRLQSTIEQQAPPHNFLIAALQTIIYFNGRKGNEGLPTPYYDEDYGIRMNLGILENRQMRESFHLRSYLLRSVVDLLVRAGRRDILELHWREVTYIHTERFIPAEKWMAFLRYSAKGEIRSEYFKQTQSWQELYDEATNATNDEVPNQILQNPYFLPLFLVVFPHRLTPQLVRFLDDASFALDLPKH